MDLTRRTFVGGLAAAASLPAASPFGPRRGALEELRVAVVGIRSRGQAHINGFRKLDNVSVVAVCDADRSFLDREKKRFDDRGEPLAVYTDVRRLLEARDVDVIAVATPNHWHALMGVWSCQAGKDVYLEKPVSHTVWEGRKLVEAAARYERIVASGTQSRSNPGMQDAVAFIHQGKLGAIRRVVGLCYKPRPSIGKVQGPQSVPESVDYDLWCGPAVKGPLTRKSLHYDWHWVWNTGNGDLGNQGVHQVDIGRWILGQDQLPPRIYSVGGRVGYDDDGETANSQVLVFDYEPAPMVFEVRGLPREAGMDKPAMDKYRGASIGVIVECEGGVMSIPSYNSAVARDHDGNEVARFKGGGNHFANFVGAVRERDPSMLNADARQGHLSSALCHLGNISHRLGRPATVAEIGRNLGSRPTLQEPFARLGEHLGANGLGADTALSFGPMLTIDPETEQVLDHPDAAPHWRRTYRSGFEVPESL